MRSRSPSWSDLSSASPRAVMSPVTRRALARSGSSSFATASSAGLRKCSWTRKTTSSVAGSERTILAILFPRKPGKPGKKTTSPMAKKVTWCPMPHHIADIARLPVWELERTLSYGERPEFSALDGFIFKGANLTGAGALLFPRFAKGFFTERGRTMGYNVPVERGPITEPYHTKPRERPQPFGFYEVVPQTVGGDHTLYPSSSLLDYSKGGNWGPERLL